MLSPISHIASGNCTTNPGQHKKSNVLDNHTCRIMDDMTSPEKSVRVEHDEQRCLNDCTQRRRNSAHDPCGKRDLYNSECPQKRCSELRAEPRHCRDYLELQRHTTK